MKNLKITLLLIITMILGVYAQEQKKTNFLLSPKTIEVYDFEASTKATKGKTFQYEFEDDYTIKLTNTVYKVSLKFEGNKQEHVQQLVSKILDGNNSSSGFSRMVWKKTTTKGQLMYEVELKKNKLKLEVNRAEMNDEAYQTLNDLGTAFIKEINS